ncbi:hypothetical protein IJG90_03385 [Candidatus Saccharibacteria bacterium]|nr:hypothetical protein [Candidatus Saccharibacteria bacterium]
MLKRLLKTLILLVILAGLGFWGFTAVKERQININRWFVGGMTREVDVSSYQEKVDFGLLQEQGVEFAYIKATEGEAHVDDSFKTKWEAATLAGVPVGAYHYFSYYASGAEQAENFIATMGELVEGRLIPAVDMELTVDEVYEPPEVSEVVKGLKAFLAVVEEKYGVKPLIYAQKDYYDKYLAADFAEYPRWVRNVFYPALIDYGEEWMMWQYDDRGELKGYDGEKYIDMNVINNTFGLDALKIK